MCKQSDHHHLPVHNPLISIAAKIDRLAILGIRSFDNKRSETIQFHTPLTLIVGYNGSGKTTIIECLKYSTTGIMPPNSKGGAFIHDPKVCGEKEVLGQVKLSFRATTGHQMVVTRNMQVTVKKNTVQFKSLEGVIQTKTKDGERTSVSSRVAELDQVMPQYLGVSKAVLDSVIFCHQDESLWPLSEPAPLKKKFDEIFEALKYSKAVDNIKALRKAKNEDLKLLKEAETSSKHLKNLGDKAEKQSRELDAEIKQLKDEITDLNTKTREAEQKYRDAFDHETQFERVANQLDDRRTREGWVRAQITKLGNKLEMRSESDEWLQSELDRHQERIVDHKLNVDRQTEKYKVLERSIKESEEKLSKKHTEAGKYEEQKANHEQQMEKRKALIKETSRHHKIRGYETDLDDMQINEYLERISKLCKDQVAAVEKARREAQSDTEKAQDVLNRLGERNSVLEGNKNSAHANITANQRKIGTLQSELNNIEIDEGEKAILQANIGDLEARLKKARDDSRQGSWNSKISEGDLQLRGMKEERQLVNNDLIQANRQAGEIARLALLKDEVIDRQRRLDTMKGVHNDKISTVVGRTWEPARLEVDFHNVVTESRRLVKEEERHRDLVSRGLEQVEYKLSNAKSDLKKAEKELATCVKRLTENVDGEPEDYLETLSEIQRQRDILKADFDNFGNMKKYFSQAIQKAQGIHPKAKGKHICNLCERPFNGEEQAEFLKKMQEKIENDTAEQVARDLKDLEDELRNAKEAGPSYDTWLRLSKTEVPRLQEVVKSLGVEREKILLKIESHDGAVTDREDALRDAESLAKPVALIIRYDQEMTSFIGQRDELLRKQNDVGTSRTLDDIQEQLATLDENITGVENNLAKLRIDEERARSLISTLELDLSKATNSLSTANYQLEKKQDIIKRIEELKSANRDHQDTIKRLDAQLKGLAAQISEGETKIEEVRQRGRAKVNSMQQEASKLENSVRKLDFAAQNIKMYIEDGGPAKLARCRREIGCVEQEISEIKDEQRQVTVSINKIRQELNSQDQIERTITDNLEFRKNLRELDEIKGEISRLSAQNADADRRHWHKQAAHWKRIFDEASSEKTRKLGAATAKDNQLAGLIRDWNIDYKGAAYNFKKAHIEVETTKAAVEDLGRYASALDKAIMKYHSIKMEEINRIIEELWRKTYQGTDVDSILIRSDSEAAKGNCSYNYRVCMVKQDAEMDMRGRCSAGQKVLASIIIRLALAECFGVNCGLIALDEPTTNLDRDNIQSLATSLHDIIEARRHQSNFQLIVITHDEDFLKFMKCPDFCDNYYRVSRNDRQKSEIEKQSIAEVM